MENAIQLYDRCGDNPMAMVKSLGEVFMKSTMFGAQNESQAQTLALACMTERMSPFEVLRKYHLVDGHLAMRSDAMLAGFMAAGGKVKWLKFTNDIAEAEFTFDGVTTKISFTIEDAKQMKVVKDNSGWTKAPDAMLRARLVAKAVRMLLPGVVSGYQTPEEIQDPAVAGPTKEIKMEAPATTVSTEAPKETKPKKPKTAEAPPIDVTATVKTPEQEVMAELAKAEPGTVETVNGKLTPATVAMLQEAIGEANSVKAMDWMYAKPWLKANEGLHCLAPERAKKILNNPAGFLAIIGVK